MKRILFLVILFVAVLAACSQQQTTGSFLVGLRVATGGMFYFDDLVAAKVNLQEFFIETRSGRESGDAVLISNLTEKADGEHASSITVSPDGKIQTVGEWSKDDWLTVLAAEKAITFHINFLEEKALIEAAKDVPPGKIETSRGPWKVRNVTRWDPYIQGDSNCALHRIRVAHNTLQKHETVLHEMMHVASGCDSDENLHRAIQQISPKLLKIMRDNPEMVSWMLSGKTGDK